MNDTLSENRQVLYAVLKLNREIESTNPFSGKQEYIRLRGCAGYIPVFETIEEAKKASQNGKYDIAAITVGQLSINNE